MAENYVLLERIELNASAASVTFSNIPQTGYTDLKLIVSARSNRTSDYIDDIDITFNGTGSNYYSVKNLSDNQGTAGSDGASGQPYLYRNVIPSATTTANTFGNLEMYIPNYSVSGVQKSTSKDSVTETNGTQAYLGLTAGLWNQTAAITSITLTCDQSTFTQYSTFSLYGIANVNTTPAIAPKASGGNVIATDGTYWYHAFLSSGTFTPAVALTADVLVVAGGGGGGSTGTAGGGGAGGLLAFTESLITTNYTCVIGSGGAVNTNGNDSQFSSLTLVKGGGYGVGNGTGGTGASGGGGGIGSGAGGSASPSGQGNAGGSGYSSTSGTDRGAGGGGGKGAVGSNGASGTGGTGGAGVNTYSTWATATATGVSGYFAGGGGGGSSAGSGTYSGGAGGGGAGTGSGTVNATAGTANTGGGGGGGGTTSGVANSSGAAGGSGIVIIRYPIA